MKVGILGGSFDPPHLGHVSISLEAIKRFNLHQLWWVITEQNPLKQAAYYSILDRCKLATCVARSSKIKILSAGHRRTYDELQNLKRKYPTYQFVWIMGTDNLLNIHKWHKWVQINDLVPFIIFDRDGRFYKVMKSRFMLRFSQRYCDIFNMSFGKQISVIRSRRCDLSSTMLRALAR